MRRVLMLAPVLILSASAASISVDRVVQRWPWNNKVDIQYTVEGAQDVSAGVYAKIVFTANIAGNTYTIDGVSDIAASASDGTHVVTWTLPAGLRSNGCTMTAEVLSSDAPSGDDYIVINLADGSIAYEGLMATQELSNERYNTDVYKTDKLVLRKIPAGGPYATGDNTNFKSVNSYKEWTTDRDYYAGIFLVTQQQYLNLCKSNPSTNKSTIEGNTTAHRPVETVSYQTIRGAIAPTAAIPSVDSATTGSFFSRLNYITGLYCDLPTEVMFEIAARAGATTPYSWGDELDRAYYVSKETSGGSTAAVGSRKANDWGLFDTAGNVYEWCLDDNTIGDLATTRTDVFTPTYTKRTDTEQKRTFRGGVDYRQEESLDKRIYASYRDMALGGNFIPSSTSHLAVGFRVYYIAE